MMRRAISGLMFGVLLAIALGSLAQAPAAPIMLMAQSGGSSGGATDNPDGLTAATEVIDSRDYDVDNGATDFASSANICTGTWGAGSGYGGSGGWVAVPDPITGATSQENYCGWPMLPSGASNFPVDAYELIVTSFMFFITPELAAEIENHLGFWNSAQKSFDFKYWDATGTTEGGRNCFFLGEKVVSPFDEVLFFPGNCGGSSDPTNNNDWNSALAGQWVWMAFVIDMRGATAAERYFATYYQIAGGNVERLYDPIFEDAAGLGIAAYDGRGFRGFGNCDCIFGYWDDMNEAENIVGMVADFELRLDRVRVTNGWPTGADRSPYL